jgi:hypothetical protein
MSLQPRKPASQPDLLPAYKQEAARLRRLAGSVTTARLKARLLEEADKQEQLAQVTDRIGSLQPVNKPGSSSLLLKEAAFRSQRRCENRFGGSAYLPA